MMMIIILIRMMFMIMTTIMMLELTVVGKLPVASDDVPEPLVRQFVGYDAQCLEPEVASLT